MLGITDPAWLRGALGAPDGMPEFDLDKIAERHRKIGDVLLHEWDPIGVAHIPEAQDEYRGYIRGVYDVAMRTRSAQAVAEHLSGIERHSMGLWPRRPKKLLPVGQKIVGLIADLYDPNFT